MNFWLMKSEPSTYSWKDFVKDGSTYWDGVRNYQARNNMRGMRQGDLVFFYHSVKEKQIVGIARVTSEMAYQDPTTDDARWFVVDIEPVKEMKKPVTLAEIKAEKNLKNMKLVRQSRLSVSKLNDKEFETILEMGETKVKMD